MNYSINVKQDPNLIYAWFTGAEIVGSPYAELCFEGIYTVAGAPSNIAGLYIAGAIIHNAHDGSNYENIGTTASPNFVIMAGGSSQVGIQFDDQTYGARSRYGHGTVSFRGIEVSQAV